VRRKLKMAITVTKDYPHPKKLGKGVSMLCGVFSVAEDYATGGLAATPISKYFKDVKRILFDSTDGYNFEFDNATNKILIHAGGFEVADGTTLAITGISFFAIGYR